MNESKVSMSERKVQAQAKYSNDHGAETWTAPREEVPAHDVTGVSVVINGGPVSETN